MGKILVRLLLIILMGCPFLAYSSGAKLNTKIIGGIVTTENEIPWQAYLNMTFLEGGAFLCGGVVIAEDVVLTAAHCVQDGDTGEVPLVKVWAGIIDIRNATNLKAVLASDIVIHPSYNSSTLANDIAIIKLASPLPDLAKPILMADRDTQDRADNAFANGWVDNAERDANLLVSGWGSTELEDNVSVLLRQTLLSGVPDSACGAKWGFTDPANAPIFLCAGSVSPNKERDSCSGDSGGPLVWQDPQVAGDSDFGLRLVGLVSFGEKVCAGEKPGVYTEVANYLGWIETEAGLAVGTLPTPVFETNPFTRDYSTAGVVEQVASSGSGGVTTWWALLGLLMAGYVRRQPLLSKSKAGQGQG